MSVACCLWFAGKKNEIEFLAPWLKRNKFPAAIIIQFTTDNNQVTTCIALWHKRNSKVTINLMMKLEMKLSFLKGAILFPSGIAGHQAPEAGVDVRIHLR